LASPPSCCLDIYSSLYFIFISLWLCNSEISFASPHWFSHDRFMLNFKCQSCKTQSTLKFANQCKYFLRLGPVADPIKLFFFDNKEFLRFLLLSWVILLSVIFSICNKTLKLSSEKQKSKKKKFYRIGYWYCFSEIVSVNRIHPSNVRIPS